MLVLRSPRLVAAGALLLAVLVGCEQDPQHSTAATTRTGTVAPTTTEPPATPAERA